MRVRRSPRHPRPPAAVFDDDPFVVVLEERRARFEPGQDAGGRRRHVGVREQLPVRVVDGGPDLGAVVLEAQHVGDVVAAAERRGAFGPEVDDRAGPLDAEAGEGLAVFGAVEDDLAAAVGERRPAVRERAHDVRLGRLESADAERAAVRRQVRTVLAAGGHLDHRARHRVGSHRLAAPERPRILPLRRTVTGPSSLTAITVAAGSS